MYLTVHAYDVMTLVPSVNDVDSMRQFVGSPVALRMKHSVVGPLWAGVAYTFLGRPAPYWTAALMAGLAIVGLVALMRGGRRVQEERPPLS